VDDEPQSIKYFTRAFGTEFRVLTAASTAEAEQILAAEAPHGGVGVLVADQRMPVETGVQLLVKVKERHPMVIRLLTTAYADLSDAVAAVNRGGIHRYILKPWDMESLRTDLRDCLHLHRRQKVEQSLVQARRQTMLSLASYLAHELASPLATIATAGGGLERYLPALLEVYRCSRPEGEIPRGVLAALERAPALIQESANRSRSLVQLLLMNAGSSGEGAAPRELVSASRLVAGALDSYPFRGAERDRVRVEGDDFSLSGPPILLIHVLHNLLKNALDGIQAAGKGGIRLMLESGSNRNRLIVADTGSGIPPEAMPRIFDEFFSLKGPGRGTGMGLPFCRRVMSALGGEIACRSVLGEYTRLELSFPPVPGRPRTDIAVEEDFT
jgi:two-component system response regulator PhcR